MAKRRRDAEADERIAAAKPAARKTTGQVTSTDYPWLNPEWDWDKVPLGFARRPPTVARVDDEEPFTGADALFAAALHRTHPVYEARVANRSFRHYTFSRAQGGSGCIYVVYEP